MAPSKRRKTNTAPKYLCFACDVERGSKQFPDYNPTPDCEHLINTCKTCLKQWVQAQVESDEFTTNGKGGFGIKCPQCDAVMRDTDVEMAGTKKVFAKFVDRERKHVAEGTPGWFRCLAPDCNGGHVHAKNKAEVSKSEEKDLKCAKHTTETAAQSDDIFECEKCGSKACVPCQRPWHEGETCKAYRARTKDRFEEEDDALREIQRSTKKCPNCMRNIEKNGGCSLVTCTQCFTAFCWTCRSKYAGRPCKCVTEYR